MQTVMESKEAQSTRIEDLALDHDGPPLADFDIVSTKAIGGNGTADLPPHYFRSFRFIGTIAVKYFTSSRERNTSNTRSGRDSPWDSIPASGHW